eukprot:Ihof_evm1s548 gene=Ihof_evmTU1s548
MDMVSGQCTPVNIVLTVIIIYLLKKVLTPPVDYSKTIILDAPQEKVEPKAFTLEELKKFNGVEDPKIYLGVSGKVYDVTAKKNFYGPEGPYGLFAGHDASRALAMGDLSGNTISMEWDTL